ncbi:unnamed protein product [Ixodes persulcatus]
MPFYTFLFFLVRLFLLLVTFLIATVKSSPLRFAEVSSINLGGSEESWEQSRFRLFSLGGGGVSFRSK